MKLSIEFTELRDLVRAMGAPASSWSPGEVGLSERDRFLKELEVGKEIPIEDVEVAHGSLLSYKGEQVVLYIKHTGLDRDTLLYDIDGSRRFHIAECRTLDRMRREGRFEKYVVTNKATGVFSVEATDPHTGDVEELEAELRVCKNCLTALDWKGYQTANRVSRTTLWKEFSLDDFFGEFSTFFRSKPKHTDETAPKGGYAANWSKISERTRRARDWTCEGCEVQLEQHPSLLHCHHKNGVVSDNSRRNLEVLCVVCHSQQPSHGWMKPSATKKLTIERLRAAQGLGATRRSNGQGSSLGTSP